MMVDLAPGERALAAGHGTGVVEQGQRPSLGARVEPPGSPEVERQRVAAEDGRDQSGVASQPPGLTRGDRDAGVQPSRAEPGEQRLEVERDQELAPVRGVAAGGEMLDQLAPRGSPHLVDVGSVTGARNGHVDHRLVPAVTGEPARRRESVEGLAEEVAVELGDPEPTAIGAVAVVVQRQERLGLGRARLATEQDRLVPVGEVGVDRVEHPPSGLA
jgi:hypothetical protein